MLRRNINIQSLMIIGLLCTGMSVYASDDEADSENSRPTTPYSPLDETAFGDPSAELGTNPLFQVPLGIVGEEVQEDLTTARDNINIEDDKDDNKNQAPTPEMIAAMEARVKFMTEQVDRLILRANSLEETAHEEPEIRSYRLKIQKLRGYPEAYQRANQELATLKSLPKISHEAIDVRTYLDWLVGLPWDQGDKINIDIAKARAVLDREHSGLDKIKQRIIEELAVRKRMPKGNQPILCFIGPPGVGKTTLAKAIAEATGRKFARISLGGVRDESKIRGFLRTYSGSRPGQIVITFSDLQTNNPVILLDEVDKMEPDSRNGDPAAALLEVLDPSQNSKFTDHYLEVPFDLSNAMFIATANSHNIPGPLLDRMEIIELSSYTQREKLAIAQKYLVPKVVRENGLQPWEAMFMDSALEFVISNYTSEAGVRNLERCLGDLCRKTLLSITDGKTESIIIDRDRVREFLGRPKVKPTQAFTKNKVGSTQGLAWTSVGGTLLPIEAKIIPGAGHIVMTGNLGDVMKESVTAAQVVFKSLLSEYKIPVDYLKDKDIHVHAPEAAVKKDGPSAGITITTSLISAITGIPVSKGVAMTGEINLAGEVMPIGGLKEKLIAAHTAGLSRVIIPADNEADLEDVPEEVKLGLEILPVGHIRDVLKYALVKED